MTQGCAGRHSHEQELLSIALLKLELCALIRVAASEIAITEEGRQFLDEGPSVSLQPVRPRVALLGSDAAWIAEFLSRLVLWSRFTEAWAISQRSVEIGTARARNVVLKKLGEIAPLIDSSATVLLYRAKDLTAGMRPHAEAWSASLRKRLKQSWSWLATAVAVNSKSRAQLVVIAGAFLVLAVAVPACWYLAQRHNSGLPADAVEEAQTSAISPVSAPDPVAPSEVSPKPSDAMEQHSSDSDSARSAAEESTTDPIILSVRQELAEPELRKGDASRDLAALEAFYAARSGPPLWITSAGVNEKAELVINELRRADDWGLSADAFDLPTDVPGTTDAQANDEINLGIAILKYARFARGGRLLPGRISDLLDQRPNLLDPKTVLTEIAASESPDAYLRSLHPKNEQFERLRQALLKARARRAMGGNKLDDEREIQRLVVNMERWRWMPATLGSYYVWDNIPEFTAQVIKNGRTIYVDKTIVGQPKYPTPIFSAEMRSIVFHPEWTVPETIVRDDLQPALQHGGFFGGPNTAILEEHGLKVSYGGNRVDASSVDWANANIWQYTFTQPPGPDNVLGALKFNFPNKHAVYMHDTIEPELFAETERTLSHGCIRVHEPDRLATVLLAEDKGWSAQQVKSLLVKDETTSVTFNRPLPVHLTYFTAVVDENGDEQDFADVYGIDNKMGAVLFGKRLKLAPPVQTNAADESGQTSRSRSAEGTAGLAAAISGFFGN